MNITPSAVPDTDKFGLNVLEALLKKCDSSNTLLLPGSRSNQLCPLKAPKALQMRI
ncbi:MAG: hypothetical protein GY938_32590 [Ketobacter sp.]|nr:hypothetical protein [Ketobacter sp.]